MNRKYYIETFGCQMNKSDSELMELSLDSEGFEKTHSKNNADIIIYNTCSVRKNAEIRATSNIRESKAHLKKRKGIVIATGCMAQRIGQDLIDKKYADIVIGPYNNPKIGKILQEYIKNPKQQLYLSQIKDDFSSRIDDTLVYKKEELPWHKWITITHGCENFCTYCIVPYVRGPLISFDSKVILDYVKKCIDNGIIEITLLGQNVNQYGQDNNDIAFYKLLDKCASISNLKKINFLTSHPKDFSAEIIDIIKDHENISKSIHLPLQSASDKILKLMNRKYDMAHYKNIVEMIDQKLDSYTLSTDLIVGFPGETSDDYSKTLETIKEIKFDEAFMYAYSPRPGTNAPSLDNQLSEEEKQSRLNNLIKVQREIKLKNLENYVDKEFQIIVEKVSKKDDKQLQGKNLLNHTIIFEGSPDLIGKTVNTRTIGVRGATLFAKKI